MTENKKVLWYVGLGLLTILALIGYFVNKFSNLWVAAIVD